MERLKTNIVSPDGPLSARMLFIGEAPGEEENWALKPFKGSAGTFLDQCLRNVGVSRGEILVSNVFAQQPPKNNVGYFFKDKSCTQLTWEGTEHVEVLKTWLEGILGERKRTGTGPNVIVALGASSTFILTGKKGISKWRGSLLPCILVPGFKVYATFHPSYVTRLMNEPEERLMGEKKKQQQNALPLFLSDLGRAAYQADFPELKTPEREFLINETFSETIRFLRELQKEKVVACDIETLPSKTGPVVWCIGFSPRPDWAITIPIIKELKLYWSAEEEKAIWIEISKLFLNPDVKKVFHNGFYDLCVLGRYYGLRCAEGSYEDTMFHHQANYPYLNKGLAVCVSLYTWEPYYKDDGKVHNGKRISDSAEFIYNGRDCCVTREIWPQIQKEGREQGTVQNYELSKSVFSSLLHKQIRGVKIDIERKETLAIEFGEQCVELHETIEAIIGTSINPNSSQQMRSLIYGGYNLPLQISRKTGKPTLDKDARNKLLRKVRKGSDEERILTAYTNYQKFSKLSKTYTEMEVDVDGRIHTSYQWVSTFRLSSSQSFFGGGGNLQNIPTRTKEGKEIRKLFIPDNGLVFLASDLAQAEAREVAWLAKDKKQIEAFSNGWDIHWEKAKGIFGLGVDTPYEKKEEIPNSITGEEHPMKFYRDLAKTIVHATNYRMGAMMLQTILIREEVFLEASVCKQLLISSKNTAPLVAKWQTDTIEEIRATRTLTTALGDKRVFRGRLNENLFRSAIAFRPQSVVGRLLQIAIQKIYEELPYMEVLMNVHDEVIVQLREEDIPRAMVDIRERLEIPHEVGGKELIIPCDFKWGRNWGELEEIEE